jgi:hypothetical protein
VTDAYLGGANVPSSARFLGSGNAEHEVTTTNYYLHGVVSETWLKRYGVLSSSLLLALMVGTAIWSLL